MNDLAEIGCFNPRLTSAARRTRIRAYYEHKYRVSIRASLQQRGERHGIEEQRRLVSSFNPRLTSAARRTRRETRSGEWKRLFQSAPHFSSEANARRHGPAGNFRGVSIRASLQQRGERVGGADRNERQEMFQSAPHFSSEANDASKTSRSKRYSFQSAPHFSSEANVQMVLIFLQRGVSIRASLQQRGELDLPCICELPPEVSIRASLQQRGEPCRGSERAVRTGFQSAPHFSSEANILGVVSADQGD